MSFDHIHPYFPIKQERTYLNNASIGAMSTKVIEAVNSFMADVRDNGRINYPTWCHIVDTEYKARLARLIGAHAEEIAYVKNTTGVKTWVLIATWFLKPVIPQGIYPLASMSSNPA